MATEMFRRKFLYVNLFFIRPHIEFHVILNDTESITGSSSKKNYAISMLLFVPVFKSVGRTECDIYIFLNEKIWHLGTVVAAVHKENKQDCRNDIR